MRSFPRYVSVFYPITLEAKWGLCSRRDSGRRGTKKDPSMHQLRPRVWTADNGHDRVTNARRPVRQEIAVSIVTDVDIVTARQRGRALAAGLGFSLMDATLIAAAISELPRNILQYARRGQIVLATAGGGRTKIVVVASDEGPGVVDRSRAVALARARQLMDQVEISSVPGRRTTVTTPRQQGGPPTAPPPTQPPRPA